MAFFLTSIAASATSQSSKDRRCAQLAESVEHARARAVQDPVRGVSRLIRAETSFQATCGNASSAPQEAIAPNERPDRCEILKQRWLDQRDRIEAAPRRIRGVSPALIDFNKECPDQARSALAADQSQKVENAAPPVAKVVPLPPGPVSRSKTPGHFVDWDNELTAQCDTRTLAGRTLCAQRKIERAVAENRLSQAEIDACQPARSQDRTSRTPGLAQRQRDLQDKRLASLGGDAYWKWNNGSGCQLAELVKQTFAADSFASATTAKGASTVGGTQQSSPPVGDYSGIDPARARSKSTRIEGTPFRTAKPGESFSSWATYAYSACANLPADRKGGDRDYCPKTVVATALQLGLISDAAITQCRSAPQRPQQSEALSIYNCLERGSFTEMSESSSIVVSVPTSEKTSTLNTTGLMKPTLVSAIHAADWAGVPPSDLDWVYFLTTFRQISERCPNIVKKTSLLDLEMSIAKEKMESARRGLSGQGSSEDTSNAAIGVAKALSYEDCNEYSAKAMDYEYESCQARNEEREKPLESPEAKRDVKVLLDRYGCGQQISTYTSNFRKSQSLKYKQLGARYYIDNMKNAGDVAKYRRIFENCAHQAGDGAAYAWCGCYVRGLSLVRGGYANPPEAIAAASRSAFFKGTGYLPSDAHECVSSGEAMINSWRSSHTSFTTACLVSSTSATGSITPGLMACEYKTAWGKIIVRDRSCENSISSKTWGDIPINCR